MASKTPVSPVFPQIKTPFCTQKCSFGRIGAIKSAPKELLLNITQCDKKHINRKLTSSAMKSYTLPTISADSLGNSLFECIAIDTQRGLKPLSVQEPVIVQAGIICVCLRGSGTIAINDKPYEIASGTLLTILPNAVVRSLRSSDDFLGYAIAADTKFMASIQLSDVVKSYLYISENPLLKINQEQTDTIIELCEMLRRRRENTEHAFGKEICRHLLTILCYEIYGFYQSQDRKVPDVESRSRQGSLCKDFLKLVEQHATQHRDLSFYADKLCITSKYLSVVVRKASGRSPVEWIDGAIMRYARTLLSSSDMTVQQISAELGFPNPSFFGQFFKRHEGTTPKHYRSQRMTSNV